MAKVTAPKLCAHCGRPRKPPAQWRYATRAEWEADPFCSAQCCRDAHGVVDPESESGSFVGRGQGRRKFSKMTHGTEAMYVNEKCRCGECRAAASEARRARRDAA